MYLEAPKVRIFGKDTLKDHFPNKVKIKLTYCPLLRKIHNFNTGQWLAKLAMVPTNKA
ncbi:hypothetical protein SERLADRAFT_367772 [Serpula lacrymans var. lacrymans S7.9]|uniref:Uncharacterized protein n=1 Tax=Serpula lacrymans var. lacrymans (strain S7.9) TaxID=578457 RepID=F8NQZ5_SERL9|nr:uncharacterized protein SERLADRAFT_367772 [Serpula lacrymans var. lacrymans S7.9]EGO26168.1 hypothetical protein SERLADRAFT_367772 [Serpula lacrymans var. lacrymans S7.9]